MGQILLARTLGCVQVCAALVAQPAAVLPAEDTRGHFQQKRGAHCLVQLKHMARIQVLILVPLQRLTRIADERLLQLGLDLSLGGS